jgi:hypothetical protein
MTNGEHQTPLTGFRGQRTYEDVVGYTDFIKLVGLVMREGHLHAAARKAEALGLDRVASALHGKAALAAGNN